VSAPHGVLPGYRLRRLLHRGHSFDVYDAWSEERACPVVVKRARPGATPAAQRRLVREGTLLRRLTHPHLVRAYEVVREPRVSVVLETLPGQTLGHLFHEAGPLPVADVAELGSQLAAVVGYLHRHDLIHADLKPGNATVSDGLVRLIDLSLARAPGLWRSDSGTPGYISPEQARRQRISPATDVWGIGLVLLEAASGDDPFPVGTAGYDEEHGPLASPEPLRARRRVPRSFADLVDGMTSFNPADRPSVAEVLSGLQPFRRTATDDAG